jgi:hypothetical protein
MRRARKASGERKRGKSSDAKLDEKANELLFSSGLTERKRQNSFCCKNARLIWTVEVRLAERMPQHLFKRNERNELRNLEEGK